MSGFFAVFEEILMTSLVIDLIEIACFEKLMVFEGITTIKKS
jgi:hypothetical protein